MLSYCTWQISGFLPIARKKHVHFSKMYDSTIKNAFYSTYVQQYVLKKMPNFQCVPSRTHVYARKKFLEPYHSHFALPKKSVQVRVRALCSDILFIWWVKYRNYLWSLQDEWLFGLYQIYVPNFSLSLICTKIISKLVRQFSWFSDNFLKLPVLSENNMKIATLICLWFSY